MTPKEKAKELHDKFCYAIRTEERVDGYFTNVLHGKHCALIAVDEILNNSVGYWAYDGVIGNDIDADDDYWHEVKNEIEKL